MADDFACYVSSPNTTFSDFVDESKADGNSFSVLTWGYDGDTYRLYIDHIVETQSDDDYYYELYYTNGTGANGISSTSELGSYVCCVRYSKYEKISEFDKTNLYMHNMKYSDYKGVFGSNLKNSQIYSWHGNDYCVNFYWHSFSGEKPVTPQTWVISNDIPYKDIFPILCQITEYPNVLWRQVNGELPYKTCFPGIFNISDAPASMWRISDDIPYKLSFPDLFKFTDAPACMWIICDDIPYKSQFPEMPSAPFITFKPVQQRPYICVYDMHTPMNEFDDNGLCILMPCKCEITEELNGSYDLTLEHPIDAEGRWRFLLEANIIKADGQLFRIYSKQTKLNSDGSRIRTVKARHIFYDLNDKLLMDVRPENRNGHDFLEWIFNRIYDDDPEHYYPVYTFSYDSDIVSTATAYYVGVSVTASLIGEDNCFIN